MLWGELQRGLVDPKSAKEFDEMLTGFKARWNELKKPYNSPQVFHGWFVKHCSDNMVKYMLPSVREKAGLGSPNEEKKVQYKLSQLPEFV